MRPSGVSTARSVSSSTIRRSPRPDLGLEPRVPRILMVEQLLDQAVEAHPANCRTDRDLRRRSPGRSDWMRSSMPCEASIVSGAARSTPYAWRIAVRRAAPAPSAGRTRSPRACDAIGVAEVVGELVEPLAAEHVGDDRPASLEVALQASREERGDPADRVGLRRARCASARAGRGPRAACAPGRTGSRRRPSSGHRSTRRCVVGDVAACRARCRTRRRRCAACRARRSECSLNRRCPPRRRARRARASLTSRRRSPALSTCSARAMIESTSTPVRRTATVGFCASSPTFSAPTCEAHVRSLPSTMRLLPARDRRGDRAVVERRELRDVEVAERAGLRHQRREQQRLDQPVVAGTDAPGASTCAPALVRLERAAGASWSR